MSTSTVKDSFTVAKGWRKRGAGRIKLMNTTQTQVRSTDEALKMALEALKDNQHLIADNERHAYVMEYNSIIEKCEEALAQQSNEQIEPVAKVKRNPSGQIYIHWRDGEFALANLVGAKFYTHPHVPTAQPKEPEQEPNHDKK